MKARLVRLEKRLDKPFLTGTNLTFEKNGNGEAYLARLNSIQIDRLAEQTEKDFIEKVQTVCITPSTPKVTLQNVTHISRFKGLNRSRLAL